nr:MAG TPA: hypothetical protein [Caudoviricetes sp.]
MGSTSTALVKTGNKQSQQNTGQTVRRQKRYAK